MQQQINLYLPEFRVEKDPITALLMGQILAGVLGLMVLVTVFDLFNQWRLGGQLEVLQATLSEETRRTSELDEQLARRSQNQELTRRLNAAEAAFESSQQIRDFLSETKLGNVSGFSEHFKDISRASINGLSITGFRLTVGGESAQISGQVIDSELVPRYVANIENGNSLLSGMRFSPTIRRSGNGTEIFSFDLASSNE